MRLFRRRDVRKMLALFRHDTLLFTGLAVGHYGFGIIKKVPKA